MWLPIAFILRVMWYTGRPTLSHKYLNVLKSDCKLEFETTKNGILGGACEWRPRATRLSQSPFKSFQVLSSPFKSFKSFQVLFFAVSFAAGKDFSYMQRAKSTGGFFDRGVTGGVPSI